MKDNNAAEKTFLTLHRGTGMDGQLMCVCSDQFNLKGILEILLREDRSISFTDVNGNEIPSTDGKRLTAFREAWNDISREELNSRLIGAYVGVVYDGALI